MMGDLQKYIDEIQRRRKAMGVSLCDMALDLEMAEMTLTKFLNGKSRINAEYFLDICDYVGLELWEGGGSDE